MAAASATQRTGERVRVSLPRLRRGRWEEDFELCWSPVMTVSLNFLPCTIRSGLPSAVPPVPSPCQRSVQLDTRSSLDRIPLRIPPRYAAHVATEQIAVRLPETLLSDLGALVKSGAYESRAAAVRAGIEAIMKLELQRQTDRAVVDGYTRQPPTETEENAALASLREAILDEPW